ncbi:MAG: 2Fe-2S iron-sulfur cluster-binding protein, partial [Intestinibacter bartlettii]|nr:2Fe-2S iron-sulfur cluster-binding protein [Intestinibacter bartlettii]
MVKLTIDGIQVEAEKGTSVLHAAESVGIKIPTLCYIKDLLPDGSCRMCMVEIESRGRTKMETACTAQVSEGLVVTTNSEKVRNARRNILDMLLSNHKTDCFS